MWPIFVPLHHLSSRSTPYMATYLLLFSVIALSPFSAFADVTWSIDCGASDSYTDGSSITWQGDDTLISSGESRSVTATNTYHVTSTLRVFTSGSKNCYVLKGEKGAKLLLRAIFFYGNYDGKSSPPSFGLQIDGVDWVKVATFSDMEVYYELIYVTKGDSISLCLVQTNPDHYPFISAIQVRTLASKMYPHVDADQALSLIQRLTFGAEKTIRYPSDAYDRIWSPAPIPTGTEYVSVAGTASLIDTASVPDNPPQVAVKNALTTAFSSAGSLKGTLALNGNLDSTPVPVYVNLYFSEMDVLDDTDKRSFKVYLGSGTEVIYSSTEITPSYGRVTELSIYNIMASSSTSIRLTSTSDSMLPPILNAMELFQVFKFTASSPASSSPGAGTSSGGGSSPTTTNTGTSTSTDAAPLSGGKSKLLVVLGSGVPSFLLLVAFVVVVVTMHQKRQRAAMAAATAGSNGQRSAYNGSNNNGQMVMNDFKVNIEDRTTSPGHPNHQLECGSPDPLLNRTH